MGYSKLRRVSDGSRANQGSLTQWLSYILLRSKLRMIKLIERNCQVTGTVISGVCMVRDDGMGWRNKTVCRILRRLWGNKTLKR